MPRKKTQPKLPGEELKNEIIGYGIVVFVAMIMIYMIYIVAQTLIGQLPATVGSIIIGLAALYIVFTNGKVRESIKDWGKKK